VPGAIIAVMPLVLFVAGLAALAAGWMTLRSFGPRYRIGRLLASTPEVTIAEAVSLADGPRRYVRIRGRIDSDDEFEDDAHRPLVFRRTRFALRRRDEWVPFEERREAVEFRVRENLDEIRIDSDALDIGLTVVPRESLGTAADVLDRVPEGTPPETPVRMRIEQLSSVEHAIVLGVPLIAADGMAIMTAGLGRPLVVTTLEPPDAMRILTEGATLRPRAAALSLAAGVVLIGVAILWALVDAVT
jgi:hypothetical protein